MLKAALIATGQDVQRTSIGLHEVHNFLPDNIQFVDVFKHVMGENKIESFLLQLLIRMSEEGAIWVLSFSTLYSNAAKVHAVNLPIRQSLANNFSKYSVATPEIQSLTGFR